MKNHRASALGHKLTQTVKSRGDGIAIIDGGKRLTWLEFHERVTRLASVFLANGLSTGGRVALLSLNSHRSIEAFFAALHAGGVIVPLNHRLSTGEIADLIRDCQPDIIILGDEFAGLAAQVAESSVTIIYSGDLKSPRDMLCYEEELSRAPAAPDARRHGDDLACLLYTSGTTSAAKGVMLSHANFIANTANTVAELDLGSGSVHLHHGPLFHVASAARLFSVTEVGGTHVFLPRFDARQVIAELGRVRVTHATFVPTMFRAMLDEPSLATADLSALSMISYGSAPMPETLLDEMMQALPYARFLQSYGMTELSPVATILGWRDHLPEARSGGILRSAGRPVPLSEVAVIGPDGTHLPARQAGEIIVRGPNVMRGYWNRPELTAEALRGGWMHTGDIGYIDDRGYLFVVDRLKDMIISGGENIYSQEVENVISTYPAVSQCAVFGLPHSHWGEAVHAIVTLKPAAAATPDDIIAHCRLHLAHYKCPRTVTLRSSPMPLSGANKILKTKLRDEILRDRHEREGN